MCRVFTVRSQRNDRRAVMILDSGAAAAPLAQEVLVEISRRLHARRRPSLPLPG